MSAKRSNDPSSAAAAKRPKVDIAVVVVKATEGPHLEAGNSSLDLDELLAENDIAILGSRVGSGTVREVREGAKPLLVHQSSDLPTKKAFERLEDDRMERVEKMMDQKLARHVETARQDSERMRRELEESRKISEEMRKELRESTKDTEVLLAHAKSVAVRSTLPLVASAVASHVHLNHLSNASRGGSSRSKVITPTKATLNVPVSSLRKSVTASTLPLDQRKNLLHFLGDDSNSTRMQAAHQDAGDSEETLLYLEQLFVRLGDEPILNHVKLLLKSLRYSTTSVP